MLDDLAGGLADQVQGDAIFSACVLGGIDHRYRPEAEYLIEQVEHPLPGILRRRPRNGGQQRADDLELQPPVLCPLP